MTLILRPTIKLTKRNSLNSVILPLSLILFLLCQINQIITIKQKQTPTTNCCPKRNGQILNLNPLPFFFSISYQTSFVWLYWCISNKTFLSFSENIKGLQYLKLQGTEARSILYIRVQELASPIFFHQPNILSKLPNVSPTQFLVEPVF